MADTFDLLSTVLDTVVSYYSANGFDLPGRRYVSAGVPVWDCDQVTVRGVRRFPHTGDVVIEEPQSFMQIAQEGVTCEVTIVRCAPAFANEAGDPPSVADMNGRSLILYDDSDHVLTAIREAAVLGLLPGCHGVVFLGWSNDGEEGDFMGGTTTVALTQAY